MLGKGPSFSFEAMRGVRAWTKKRCVVDGMRADMEKVKFRDTERTRCPNQYIYKIE